MPFKSMKEQSKINFGRELCEKQQLSNEELKMGAIFRIADACELIAQNHQRLVAERDKYKQWFEKERQITLRLCHRISGLQGYINRIKKGKQRKR